MADETSIRAAIRTQADLCRQAGAPIMGRVCDGLAMALDRTSATGRRVLDWPGHPLNDALPLRLAAPFHALARRRTGAIAEVYAGAIVDPARIVEVLRDTVAAHDAALLPWLDGPPQTNEPARSGVLMAGLLALADGFEGDIELLEIGSSAGLNLMIDRYAFDLGGVAIGPKESPIHIAPDWRGSPPPAAAIRIRSVQGVDIAPVRLDDPAAAERLMAYVWVDQRDRLQRTAEAIEMARSDPPRLDQGDAADWIEARLTEPQAPGTMRVLMHSIVWQYLPAQTQQRVEAAMLAAAARTTAERPLGWIAYETIRAVNRHALTIRRWPGSGTPRHLAFAHPHGAWIDWEAD